MLHEICFDMNKLPEINGFLHDLIITDYVLGDIEISILTRMNVYHSDKMWHRIIYLATTVQTWKPTLAPLGTWSSKTIEWRKTLFNQLPIMLLSIPIFVNSLPNNKIFDWSKSKAFADDKINVTEKLKFVLGRVENIEGKWENAGYQHFLLFPQCFSKGFFLKVVKSLDCVVKS